MYYKNVDATENSQVTSEPGQGTVRLSAKKSHDDTNSFADNLRLIYEDIEDQERYRLREEDIAEEMKLREKAVLDGKIWHRMVDEAKVFYADLIQFINDENWIKPSHNYRYLDAETINNELQKLECPHKLLIRKLIGFNSTVYEFRLINIHMAKKLEDLLVYGEYLEYVGVITKIYGSDGTTFVSYEIRDTYPDPEINEDNN